MGSFLFRFNKQLASGINIADNGGGAYNDFGSLHVEDSAVYSNAVTGIGGGVYNQSAMTVEDSDVYSNTADNSGGGLYNQGSVTVAQSGIYSNTASVSGGGLFNSDTATVQNSDVHSNSVGYLGGGLFNNGSMTVEGSRFTGNRADGGGSALSNASGSSSITESCIVGNRDTAVYYLAGAAPITATLNWWGAASGPSGAGPGVGDSVSDDVDFSSFETAPILGCPTIEPDLTLEKTVTPEGVWQPGQTITYTLRFTNTGDALARSVLMTDTVPDGLQVNYVVGDLYFSQIADDPALVWEVDNLSGGASGTITLVVAVANTIVADVTFTNTAEIAAAHEVDTSDNTASVSSFVQAPRVQFESAAYSAFEDSGSATITVTLDAANPYADVEVDYSTSNGTANAGSDYTAASGTLTIPAGQSSATFDVTLIADAEPESDETVTLTLSDPVAASLGSPNLATLTLLDDEREIFLPLTATRE